MKNQRGEIATILTLVSVGLMLVGLVVGNVAVQQQTQTRSKAMEAPPEPTSALNLDNITCYRCNGSACEQNTFIACSGEWKSECPSSCSSPPSNTPPPAATATTAPAATAAVPTATAGPQPTAPPSSDCAYRDTDECISFNCKIDDCKPCIQSSGLDGYKCAPTGQKCSQPIACRSKFLNSNNNQTSQDADGMYHTNSTCSGNGYSIESAEIRSYCGVAAAAASPCTSCVGDKCIYYPEIDQRSGRADPGITQCTDTGCVSDMECSTDAKAGKCATNGQACAGEGGTKCCDEGTRLRCNIKSGVSGTCEPIPIPTIKCEDYPTKSECETACGKTRGCEAVNYAGGYAGGSSPSCWRCNTKQYCSFGDDACKTGAGKPTPILTRTPTPSYTIPACYNQGGFCANNNDACPKYAEKLYNLPDPNKYKMVSATDDKGCKDIGYQQVVGHPPGSKDTLSVCCAKDGNLGGTPIIPIGTGVTTTPVLGSNSSCKLSRTALSTDCTACILKNDDWAASRGQSGLREDMNRFDNSRVGSECTNHDIVEYWCSGRAGTDLSGKKDECNTKYINRPESDTSQNPKGGCQKACSGSASTGTAQKCNPVADSILDPCATCMNSQVSATSDNSAICSTLQQKVNYYCTKKDNFTKCTNAFNDICIKSNDAKSQCTEPQRRLLFMSPQSYDNDSFDTIAEGMKSGLINAKYASLWILNATRAPGLQRLFCDPFKGQCDFYYQQLQGSNQTGGAGTGSVYDTVIGQYGSDAIGADGMIDLSRITDPILKGLAETYNGQIYTAAACTRSSCIQYVTAGQYGLTESACTNICTAQVTSAAQCNTTCTNQQGMTAANCQTVCRALFPPVANQPARPNQPGGGGGGKSGGAFGDDKPGGNPNQGAAGFNNEIYDKVYEKYGASAFNKDGTLKNDPKIIEFIAGVGYKDIPDIDAAKKALGTFNKNITDGKIKTGSGVINKGTSFTPLDPDKPQLKDVNGNVVGTKTVDKDGNIETDWNDGTSSEVSKDGKDLSLTGPDGKTTTFEKQADGSTKVTDSDGNVEIWKE